MISAIVLVHHIIETGSVRLTILELRMSSVPSCPGALSSVSSCSRVLAQFTAVRNSHIIFDWGEAYFPMPKKAGGEYSRSSNVQIFDKYERLFGLLKEAAK